MPRTYTLAAAARSQMQRVAFNPRRRGAQSLPILLRRGRDDRYPQATNPRHRDSRHSALWQRIRPRSSGYRQQLAFEARLPLAKVSCVALDLRQRATEVGRFLSGHATMLVEIERFVSHRARLHRSAAHRTDRPSRSISSRSPTAFRRDSDQGRNAPERGERSVMTS